MLQPDSFIVVWADGDTAQVGYHADFKISASGESIYLSDASLNIIDSVNFGAQTADISFGRYPNGTGSFQTMSPTFRAQNVNNTGLNDNALILGDVKIFPNPTFASFQIAFENDIVESQDLYIINLQGKVVYSNQITQNNTTIDSSAWPPGLYFVKIGNVTSKLMVK
jgi:hypothetical protein